MMRSSPDRAAAAASVLVAISLLATACGPDRITGPGPQPRISAPSFSVEGDPPSATMLGPVRIPINGTNVGGAALPSTRTGLTVPASTAFLVSVSGTVTASSNPDVLSCFPTFKPPYGFEGAYGPEGMSYYSQLRVGVGAFTATGEEWGLSLSYDGNSAVSDTIFTAEGLEVTMSRNGLLHEVGGGSCPTSKGFYVLKSEQSISVTLLDGVGLEIDPKSVSVRKGATVSFSATSGGALVDSPSWVFITEKGAKGNTVACSSGENPCSLAVNDDGQLRVSREIGGRMRSAVASVRVHSTFALTADKSTAVKGESVDFTPIIDGVAGDAARWLWRADDGSEVANPCTAAAPHVCRYAPQQSGTMWVWAASESGSDSASASVVVKGGLKLNLLPFTFPLDQNSFTTLADEDTIKLAAEITDSSKAAQVQWEVVDDPRDWVTSGEQVKPANGLRSTLTIKPWERPSLEGTPRWLLLRGQHPGVLDQKAISYQVRAYVDVDGKRTWSNTVYVTQDVVDVIRQEYVDFAQTRRPSRDVLLGTHGSTNFPLGELIGAGDYVADNLGWITQELLDGLDSVRTHYGHPVNINAGYRNPVHNWVHVHLDQGYAASRTSNHMYGYASDLFTGRSSDVFYALSRAGALSGACMEPPEEFFTPAQRANLHSLVRNFDHVHVDWDPDITCPADWVRFANSLLPQPR